MSPPNHSGWYLIIALITLTIVTRRCFTASINQLAESIFSRMNDFALPLYSPFSTPSSYPNHNQDGDFSLLGSSVIINERINDLTWSGISLVNPKILKEYLNLDFPFDIWNTIMKPLIKERKITAHQDNSLWIDIGTIERLELARASLKEEN